MTQYYNLKNNQDSEEIKQVIKTEKRSLEAKDSGYSETGGGGGNLQTSSVENTVQQVNLNVDRRSSVSSVASLQNRVVGQLPLSFSQSQLTSPGIKINNNLVMNGGYDNSTVVNNVHSTVVNNVHSNTNQVNNSIPTASSALSSTIILAEPDKHKLRLVDPVTKNLENIITMQRIESNESNKTPLEMMSSYKHLYQKKLQFRFVQCEFDCSVCEFKCTDEEQMQSHISEHSLRDVNAAMMKDGNLFENSMR